MKLGPQSLTRFFQPLALILLLILLPPIASAQQKKPPAPEPPPKPAHAPAPKPAPKPASAGDPDGAPAGKPADKPGADNRTSAGGTSGGNRTNPTGPTNNKTASGTNTGANRTAGGAVGSNRTNTNTNSRASAAGNTNSRDTNVTTVKVITPNATTGKTGANSKLAGNPSATAGKNAVRSAPASKSSALNAARANNQPGTHALPNGGTRTVRSNGSAVEKNKAGKVTAMTTSKGATVKLDAHGHPAAIYDAHGTSITRGPHGERRVETVRADHSRLVSTGRHSGYDEHRFTRGGQEFARRTYFDHGQYYTRVYRPYFYAGYPYYLYVPPFYFGLAYYGWAYNAWAVPVAFAWGWDVAPWYAPYGYYFSPYPVYPAPAFWLTDYAIASSLQTDADDANADPGSGSLQRNSGFVLASAHPDEQKKDATSVVVTQDLKDKIAKQVKIIIADEKAAAAAQANLPPDDDAAPEQVPPSLDKRFTIFIAFSSTTLDTDDGACALTAGDIVRRTENTPDADNTVAVEVASSKKADCAVGTASRMTVDDLEEMHDAFRQRVDEGLKSLSENQGKAGIPTGPAATKHPVSDGQASPDLTVESDLKKQQEAADATEKDVQQASSESGSAD